MERFIYSLIRRLDYRDKLKEIKSPLAKLYNTSYPKGDSAIAVLRELELELADVYEENSMSEVEAEAESNVIDSFTQFCEEIEWIDTQKQTFFFRGHADASYSLLPSIMRKPEWMLHEKEMYNELRINCPGDFSQCVSHLDYLVEMQHYGLSTRLLDVTQNPLVALYFACESEMERAGEIIVVMRQILWYFRYNQYIWCSYFSAGNGQSGCIYNAVYGTRNRVWSSLADSKSVRLFFFEIL